MTIRTYASPITVADAMDTMKDVDDCIKEIDSIMYRLAIMDKQLIAQENYIEVAVKDALAIVDYRVKLYKHRAFIGKSVEGTWVYKMDAGGNHSLVLDHAGKVHSFGYGGYGQLGLNSGNNKMTPQLIAEIIDGKTIIEISAGDNYSLVLDDVGDVYSFGYGWWGQLGHRDNHHINLPKKIEYLDDKTIIEISAGGNHSLVLDVGGDVYSFGYNDDGQLGRGNNHNINDPKKIQIPASAKTIVAISAGSYHSLVLDNMGNVYSFGDNSAGQLGSGNNDNINDPAKTDDITAYRVLPDPHAGAVPTADYLAPAAKRASKLFNSSQKLPDFLVATPAEDNNDPERIAETTDSTEVFNGVDIIGTKQFLIGVNAILTHPNNINQTLVTGGDVDQPYERIGTEKYIVFNTGTYPYRAGAKHELSTGVLKGLLMQGNKNTTGTASYNTIVTAIPDNGTDVVTYSHAKFMSSTDPFTKIRGFGLN